MKATHIFTLLILSFALLGVSPGWADIIATGNGDWYSTTPNAPWPGGIVPSAGDDVVITGNVRPNTAAVTVHNLTINGSATFFNSHTVNVTGNLNLSDTAKVQQGAAITIDGNLDIGSGTTYDVSSAPITVVGNTTISGTLKDGSNDAGFANSFGNVTIQPGGTWALTDVTQWTVSGVLVNNGTLTDTGGHITFTGGGGGAPVLNLSRSGDDLTLTWDTTAFPGYLLQSFTSANGIGSTGNNWGNVTGPDASPFMTTINPTGSPVFFRLIK